ncbi:cytochrome c oxidase assembly protein [Gordonia sp. (in: high G+C Gram-positive bacteria)]|uniref:cytochrome c oxidase assembly protein n=1 Tax=Gordonia sp. (in: high G+C Gram-positive bacteria) TaxID=84139 RepID=UPI0039E55C46
MPAPTILDLVTAWRPDPTTTAIIVAVAGCYLWGWRRARLGAGCAATLLLGCLLWLWAGSGFPGAYGDTLFWARALQVVTLLMLTPFLLAAARPVTAAAALPGLRRPLMRAGRSPAARLLLSPWTTSIALLLTPWLLYLTRWYPAVLHHGAVDTVTRLWLVLVGVVYFYARLQVDPVPRRRHAGLSLLVSTAEALGDGALGVVLWQGPMVAASYYEALHRGWGPDPRTDQTIGAGILWVLGDVLGLPFLIFLFHRLRADDERTAAREDARLDVAPTAAAADEAVTEEPWWVGDPRLAERFKRG